MAEPKVSIEMFGDRMFSRELINIAQRSLDFSPVLKRIGLKWTEWIEQQFGTEGVRFNGVRWQGLSFRTIKARGGAHPILFDTGDLFDDMTSPSSVSVTDHTLHLNLSDYAQEIGGYHQAGTSRMPERTILNFTEMDRQEMNEDLSEFLFYPRNAAGRFVSRKGP